MEQTIVEGPHKVGWIEEKVVTIEDETGRRDIIWNNGTVMLPCLVDLVLKDIISPETDKGHAARKFAIEYLNDEIEGDVREECRTTRGQMGLLIAIFGEGYSACKGERQPVPA